MFAGFYITITIDLLGIPRYFISLELYVPCFIIRTSPFAAAAATAAQRFSGCERWFQMIGPLLLRNLAMRRTMTEMPKYGGSRTRVDND
jgi:hypothetical protein